MMKVTLFVLGLLAAGPSSMPKKKGGPIDFRCDKMVVTSNPNRTRCSENVVVRRDDLLVCCRVFLADADKDWQWQLFHCEDDVRAQRGTDTMWADKGDYNMATSELVLTGRPRLARGQSTMDGERIFVDTKSEQARVINPKGTAVTDDKTGVKGAPLPAPGVVLGPLPNVCPVPKRPKH